MSGKRFRIAFSFAGEKRDFVGRVASIVAERFGEGEILYDKFHAAEFAQPDLAFDLPDLYKQETDLIVAVFCPDYELKEWCGLEWRAIFSIIKEGGAKQIMLTRFGRTDAKGLHGLSGFIELDDKTPEQVSSLVLERLAVNKGHPKDHYIESSDAGGKALSSSIPNNLPRLQPFFGRQKELATVREALDHESRTWGALIDGPGGMGKTSLAVRAAYDCPADQFHRIIFVSVKDCEMDDDGVRSLGNLLIPGFLEMLNEIARELGLIHFAKAPEENRIRLLLEALRPAQALLILDNLESLPKSDRDQLFTFVKRLPQGCKAILTSRRRIGSMADTLILEKLDQAAALETLTDLARRNPLLAKTSEAERIALFRQTGGKPLLLRWVAGQLGRGSCRTLADAIHFLSACPPENDPLEFIFGDLAAEFTLEEECVLVALTYFSHPATVEHISTVAGLDEEPVRSALNTLANRSLVVPDQEEKRHSLVPMVAEFLRRHRTDAVLRIGQNLERHAYELIVGNGFKQYDRFPILDASWPIVGSALPLFLTRTDHNLQQVCDALVAFLDFTGRWDEWLWLNQQAETQAIAEGDLDKAGWRAFLVGWVELKRGRADAVFACANRAAGHWRAAQPGSQPRGAEIRLRGLGYRLKGDYPNAIKAAREALDRWRAVSAESEDVATGLSDLAVAEQLSGDLRAAERHFGDALRVARSVDSVEGVANSTGNLAELALAREEWERAESLAQEALRLSEQMGRRELIASNSCRLALSLLRQDRAPKALEHARRGVQIYAELGSPDLAEAEATLRACEASEELPPSSFFSDGVPPSRE